MTKKKATSANALRPVDEPGEAHVVRILVGHPPMTPPPTPTPSSQSTKTASSTAVIRLHGEVQLSLVLVEFGVGDFFGQFFPW